MAFEIRTLPDNWKIVKVEYCGEVITGTTPKTERADYYGGDVPFISPMDINGHRFIRKTRTTLTDNGAKEARILPPGSVLVTCIGILGKVGQIDCEATTNQQINSIIPAVRVIMPSYCFWAAHLLKRQLDILAGLQVVPIVNKRVFSNLLMPVPPLPEQRRIAEILDTIDEVIQKTEALISKLKAMKQGLLHDLLTRGLDKNGKLRDPKAHPEQFKDSPLGRIPREWGVVSIGEIASYVGSGLTPRGGSEVYKTTGVMFIRSQNVTFEGLKLEDIAFIDSKTHEQMRRSEVFAYDVLLNITGASIGRCCLLPEGFGSTNVNQHVCAIRLPNPCQEDSFYVSSVLACHIGQHQIDVLNAGGNREGLNYQQLRSFVIPWPEKDERTKAANIIAAHDACICTEEQYRDKLKLQKKGIMHDLLTGIVRVKV